MVCAVNTVAGNSLQVGLASRKADMHGLGETVPTSGNSSAHFQKRGTPFFPGIVTVFVTNRRYYTPELGRWCSRDPIEDYYFNEYAFILNGPIHSYDYLGLTELSNISSRDQCKELAINLYNQAYTKKEQEWGSQCEQLMEKCEGCKKELYITGDYSSVYTEKQRILRRYIHIKQIESWRWIGDQSLWVNTLQYNEIIRYQRTHKCRIKIRGIGVKPTVCYFSFFF